MVYCQKLGFSLPIIVGIATAATAATAGNGNSSSRIISTVHLYRKIRYSSELGGAVIAVVIANDTRDVTRIGEGAGRPMVVGEANITIVIGWNAGAFMAPFC